MKCFSSFICVLSERLPYHPIISQANGQKTACCCKNLVIGFIIVFNNFEVLLTSDFIPGDGNWSMRLVVKSQKYCQMGSVG